MPNRWLVKTEPAIYSFADLVRDRKTPWDGVSNNLALIHLRRMEPGDAVLLYHTGREKSVVGLARVARAAYPDPKVRDSKNAKDAKRVVVDFEAVKPLPTPVPIAAIREDAACRDLGLVRIPRLSVMPVAPAAWNSIAKKGGLAGDA